jgi:hypothetical protein
LLGNKECGMWVYFTSAHAIGQWVRWRFVTDRHSHSESKCSSWPNLHPPTKCEMGPTFRGYLSAVLKAMVHDLLHRVLLP